MPKSVLQRQRIDLCLKLTAMREALEKTLGEAFCPTPCLDMLLELYLAEFQRRRIYIWPLCMATRIPFSTAHRKVSLLEEQGLLMREPAKRDRRKIIVRVTHEGISTVNTLLDSFLAVLGPSPSTSTANAAA